MSKNLRVAILADPELPVPPEHYGGIERIVHLLVEGLMRKGHEVVLFAHPDSRVSCELVKYSGRSSRRSLDTARNTAAIVRRAFFGGFDVLHSFARLAYLSPFAGHSIRKIMSYQRAITPISISRATRLFGKTIEFTACSRHMVAPVESMGPWHVVHNGVSLEGYTFQKEVRPDAPLVFLGRLEEIKGPHLAIEAARAAGRRILLAGNIAPEHQQFFDRRIRPHLDGLAVEYVGPVDDREKNQLLGQAAALLMPILWDEPFGIVMAEALACGTPVIGFRRGSVPEIVADGVTGFLPVDVAGMVAAIERLSELHRRSCRTAAETHFSDRVIVAAYEALYRHEEHFALTPVTASSSS